MPAARADVSRAGVAGAAAASRAAPQSPVARAALFAYLVTCEHGGNASPAEYRARFAAHAELLASHRGYDAGALSMAKALARSLDATLIAATTSRLLVELNRSPGREFRQSPIMCRAERALREEVRERHYVPYRREVEAFVQDAIGRRERVLHVSSHSFTPTLDGTARRADVGLLYDPSRRLERELCRRWQEALSAAHSRLVVRRNYPYPGTSDGFTTYLRRRFPPNLYVGVELEVNQKYAHGNAFPAALCTAIAQSLRVALAVPL